MIELKKLTEIIDKRVPTWNFVALFEEKELYLHKQDSADWPDDVETTIQMVASILDDCLMNFWGKEKENVVVENSENFPKTMEKDYDLMTTQQLMTELSSMFSHIVLTYIGNKDELITYSAGNPIICIGLCSAFIAKLEDELEEDYE